MFDFKHLVFIFLLFTNWGFDATAQKEQAFKNAPLEESLKKNQIKEARALIEEQLAEKNQLSPEQQVYYLNRKSQVELMEGAFADALTSAKKSEEILSSIPNSAQWGETFRAVCYGYIRTGKLDSALLYAEKLYEQTKKENDPKLRRAALVAMGNISLQNKAYQKSLDFYLEALSTTESIKDSLSLKIDYYNVGLAYSQLNEHDKSNQYLLKAAERAEQENTLDLLARAYGSMADNYLDQNNYEAQETYLTKANRIAEKMGNTQLLAMGLASLAETNLRIKNYKQAISLGEQSLITLKNRPLIQLQAKVDSMLYIAYKETGDFKKALNQLESYDQKRLAIRSEAQKAKLDQLTLAFEVEKKDLLIINQGISIAEEKAKNKLLITTIASVSMLLMFLGFINFKSSKTRILLFKKEQELDQQLTNLRLVNSSTEPNISLVLEENPNDGFDHKKLFAEIIQFIQNKKLYLDPKFNQQTLVSEFGTNRQYLYEAISKSGDDNFRGIINRFRINEAKAIISDTIQDAGVIDFANISEKVGFNSYTTFYRSFKNLTGLTPNEFTSELKKDLKKES